MCVNQIVIIVLGLSCNLFYATKCTQLVLCFTLNVKPANCCRSAVLFPCSVILSLNYLKN